jgi:hypothetical protein
VATAASHKVEGDRRGHITHRSERKCVVQVQVGQAGGEEGPGGSSRLIQITWDWPVVTNIQPSVHLVIDITEDLRQLQAWQVLGD